jgi:hypothetical protein
MYVDMDCLKESYRYSTQTLVQLISSLPNGYFTPLTSLPTFLLRRIRYIDAGLAGYNVNRPNTTDLQLVNPNISSNNFLNSCLVTVNGYIMPIVSTNGIITIPNGYLQSVTNNDTRVGIISFEDIGNITTIPITPSMVILSPNKAPSDLVYIKTPLNQDYVTLLVLNGYLVMPDQTTFYPIGNGNYALSLSAFNISNKLVESDKHQYYNSNLISTYLNYNNGNDTIGLSQINTPQFISAYLTLPNTFLVQVPKSNIVINRVNILNTQLVNSIVSHLQPINILRGSQGRIVDYFYTYRDGKYLVTSPNMKIDNYVNKDISLTTDDYQSNQRVPSKPLLQSALYWEEISFY